MAISCSMDLQKLYQVKVRFMELIFFFIHGFQQYSSNNIMAVFIRYLFL